MNKNIHKMTEGAMYLAIGGALMLLDRLLPGLLDVYIPIAIALISILYTAKYDYQNGIILGVCNFFITFLFGNIYLILFNTLASICGIVYGSLCKRGYDKQILSLSAIIVFIIGEFIMTILILPIFGVSDMQEMNTMIQDLGASFNIAISDTMIKMVYAAAIFFTGLIEGLLVHLLAVIILPRLKVKVCTNASIEKFKLPPVVAYIAFIFFAIMLLIANMEISSDLVYIVMCFGMIGMLLLCMQGYFFALLYGYIIHKKNMSLMLILIIIFLMPLSFVVLAILGFLYATGPLQRYLENKKGTV